MHVYVVDDEADVARTLVGVIERLGHSASYFLSGQAFLSVAEELAPGCVLLDLLLPTKSGLDIQSELANREHRHIVAFISGRGQVPDAVKAMRAGAIDFIRKPFRMDAIRDLLQRAQDAMADMERRREQASRFDRLKLLSLRERDVMGLLGQGLSTKDVARDLDLSVRTIDMHRGNILRKLGMTNIAAALLFARDAAFAAAEL